MFGGKGMAYDKILVLLGGNDPIEFLVSVNRPSAEPNLLS